MSAQKRTASQLYDQKETEGGGQGGSSGGRPSQKERLDIEQNASPSPEAAVSSFLPYTKTSPNQPVKSTPFQLPTQISTFSYDDKHTQLFGDSALRYYVDPPRSARLDYGYDRWVRKPDDRGRLDPLLKAISRMREDPSKSQMVPDNGLVCWRGILTK